MHDGLTRKVISSLAAATAGCLLVLLLVAGGRGGRPLEEAGAAVSAEPDGVIALDEPDWPQWRGPRRDAVAGREQSLLAAWPKDGPPLLWKVGGLGLGWSSPIIVGPWLFITGDVGGDLVLFAFDLDGKPIWKARNGKAWTGSYPGARACCVYSEGKLYHLNAHGRLACFDAAAGVEQWSRDLRDEFQTRETTWGFTECPLVDGDRLIVTPAGPKGLMVAMDKRTSRDIWTTPPLADDRASYASAVLFRHAERRIVTNCTSARGFGVDADTGKLLWTLPLKNSSNVNVAAPIYHQGRLFFVTVEMDGACYELSATDAAKPPEKVWTTTLDTCNGALLLFDGAIYGCGYGKHRSWLCVDWATGKTRYEFKGLGIGAAVYADGQLYCLAEDGRAALLKPGHERFEVVGQFPFVTSEKKVRDAWGHPVVLHGRLYLRHHETLACYDVRGQP